MHVMQFSDETIQATEGQLTENNYTRQLYSILAPRMANPCQVSLEQEVIRVELQSLLLQMSRNWQNRCSQMWGVRRV